MQAFRVIRISIFEYYQIFKVGEKLNELVCLQATPAQCENSLEFGSK